VETTAARRCLSLGVGGGVGVDGGARRVMGRRARQWKQKGRGAREP